MSKLSNHDIRPNKDGKTCSESEKLNLDNEKGELYSNKGLYFIEEPIHKTPKYFTLFLYRNLQYIWSMSILKEKINVDKQEKIQ